MIDDRTLERVMPRAMVALTGDLVRATSWMLAVVLLVTCAGVYVRLAGLLVARPGENDFTIFFYTAKMAREGFEMYGPLPGTYGLDWQASHLGNLNPPHFELLVAPLLPLGYRGAVMAWLALGVALTVAAAWLALRELRPVLTLKRLLLASLLIFASAAWTSVAVTGEMTPVLVLPFTGAWVAARRGRWAIAGALLGLAASLKLFLLVFAAWLLVARRWRAVVSMAVAFVLPFVLGVAVHGSVAYSAWVHRLGHVQWWWLPMNASLRGVAERLLDAPKGLAGFAWAPWLVEPLAWLAAAVVASVTAWATWPSRRDADVDRVFATLLVAALLVSPLGWVYYLPLATAPIVALAIRQQLAGPGTARLVLAVTALAFLYLPVELTERGQPSLVATIVLASAYAWGALLLWARLILPDRTAPAREGVA